MRLDKWLWAMRCYRTRELAAQACRHQHIVVNALQAKPSREVHVGDVIEVETPPIWKKFKIIQLPPTRVGAAKLPEFLQDLTPPEDLEKLKTEREAERLSRPLPPPIWRPNKKERRLIHRFKENNHQFPDEL